MDDIEVWLQPSFDAKTRLLELATRCNTNVASEQREIPRRMAGWIA